MEDMQRLVKEFLKTVDPEMEAAISKRHAIFYGDLAKVQEGALEEATDFLTGQRERNADYVLFMTFAHRTAEQIREVAIKGLEQALLSGELSDATTDRIVAEQACLIYDSMVLGLIMGKHGIELEEFVRGNEQ